MGIFDFWVFSSGSQIGILSFYFVVLIGVDDVGFFVRFDTHFFSLVCFFSVSSCLCVVCLPHFNSHCSIFCEFEFDFSIDENAKTEVLVIETFASFSFWCFVFIASVFFPFFVFN